MEEIKNIIYNNQKIDSDLKHKVFECVSLILKKYPIAYENLYKNLSTIEIRFTNVNDKNRLNGLNVDSSYNIYENLLLLGKDAVNSNYYKNLLVHELLHVASFHDDNLGFENLYAKRGLSFNEEMTEYLTQEILQDHSFGMKIYENDINNIMLLSTIIPIEKLTTLYFTEGLLGMFKEYLKVVSDKENLSKLIVSIDDEYGQRVRNNKFNNEFKDEYIKLFISDISKKDYNDDNEVIYTIKIINQFIKRQYRTDSIPEAIHKEWSNAVNTILNKSNYFKGKSV